MFKKIEKYKFCKFYFVAANTYLKVSICCLIKFIRQHYRFICFVNYLKSTVWKCLLAYQNHYYCSSIIKLRTWTMEKLEYSRNILEEISAAYPIHRVRAFTIPSKQISSALGRVSSIRDEPHHALVRDRHIRSRSGQGIDVYGSSWVILFGCSQKN